MSTHSESQLRVAIDEFLQLEHQYLDAKRAYETAREVYFAAGDRKAPAEKHLVKLIKDQRGAVQDGGMSWSVERDRLKRTPIACELPPPELALTNAA